jgi:dTDP-4-dehydrorhamnose 3,5-epimerase
VPPEMPWEHPSKDLPVHRYVSPAHRASVLYIPAGYANGFMSLTDDAGLIFFSSAALEESREDDLRFHARY